MVLGRRCDLELDIVLKALGLNLCVQSTSASRCYRQAVKNIFTFLRLQRRLLPVYLFPLTFKLYDCSLGVCSCSFACGSCVRIHFAIVYLILGKSTAFRL